MFLARPLVSFCCQKFAYLYEMQQKVNQFQLQHPNKKQSTKDKSQSGGAGPDAMETGPNEDDDVFSGVGGAHHRTPNEESTEKRNETGQTSLAGRKRSKSGSLTVNIVDANNSEANHTESCDDRSHDSCKHHSSLLLQLSCIIQLMAVQCPTAFIHISLTSKGSSRDTIPKPSTPLDKLPMKLSEMPLPRKGTDGILRKVCVCISVYIVCVCVLVFM